MPIETSGSLTFSGKKDRLIRGKIDKPGSELNSGGDNA